MGLTLVVIAIPASATSLSYSLGTGNGTGHGSGPANVYEFVDEAVTMTASAWSNLGSDLLQVATVGQLDRGLGVCNPREGALDQCLNGRGRIQVDNRGRQQQDWVLLFLPTTVSFDEIVLDTLGNLDRDVTYWIGDLSHSADLAGAELGDLFGLGLGNAQTVFNPAGSGLLSLDLAGQEGNALLIGARLGDNNDRFMLSSLAATIVPIPPALWLFGSALGFLAIRRKKTVA